LVGVLWEYARLPAFLRVSYIGVGLTDYNAPISADCAYPVHIRQKPKVLPTRRSIDVQP
jgi:hypothetical protein